MTGVPPTGETEEGDNQALLALEVVATIAVEDSSQVRSGGRHGRGGGALEYRGPPTEGSRDTLVFE